MEQASSYPSKSSCLELENLYEELLRAGCSIKEKKVYEYSGNVIYEFTLNKPVDDKQFLIIYKRLVPRQYLPVQLMIHNEPAIRVIRHPYGKGRLTTMIILFAVTFLTIWLTGYALAQSYYSLIGGSLHDIVVWSIVYTVSFLLVLGSHEYGHLLVSYKYSIPVAGPYFIPAPPAQLGFIGTLGSIISMKSLPPTRRSLALLGLMGPLMGFLTATVVAFIGVELSTTIPIEEAIKLMEEGRVSALPCTPLALAIIIALLREPTGDCILLIHPLAFVAYVIYFVTFINLMPIGQLDGGHVVRAFTSEQRHDAIGLAVISILLLIGLWGSLFGFTFYIGIAIILMIFKFIFGRRPHPGPANRLSRIGGIDTVILIIYLALVILTMPMPANITDVLEDIL